MLGTGASEQKPAVLASTPNNHSTLCSSVPCSGLPNTRVLSNGRLLLRESFRRSIGDMFRSGPARSLARSTLRTTSRVNPKTLRYASQSSQVVNTRNARLVKPASLALTAYRPLSTSVQRHATYDHIDKKHEEAVAKGKLEPHPEEVSEESSVHQVFHEKGVPDTEKDEDMLAGVYSDLATIRDTFKLNEVPREALVVGMAGIIPYVATSLSTVYLAWDINHAAMDGHGFLLSGQTAELLLHILEPLQVGYGAVIISFLGAIHWGFEWAKYHGTKGYARYAIGVVAPAVAWPTLLLPVEYALIAQFSAFTFLYFADSRAVIRGWAPQWYSTYRFVLTFIVGASIVISLIGRGQIADKISRLPSPADRIKQIRDSQAEQLAEEERARQSRIVAEDEEEDEEEDEDPTSRPTYSTSQLNEYLQSIQQPAHSAKSSSPNLEYLTTLQKYHLATYPFENLSIHYSPTQTVSLDLDVLYEKFVCKRRGGYCMEQNAFFGTILRSIGYEVTNVGARVSDAVNGGPGIRYEPWSHMVNIITISARKYMVDVGFGGNGATAPLPLEENTVHSRISLGEMRLVTSALPEHTDRAQRLWIYQVRSTPQDAWSPIYSFTETEFFPQDYEMMNFYTSNSKKCFFTYAIVAAKMVMEDGKLVGSVTMFNGEAKKRVGNEVVETRTCRSEKERLEVLRGWFGIVLAEEEERGIRGAVTELKG
ncbi:MAG: hypothetical protein Q9218_002343 [Villophora microphyllina]